jgi:hypothetical protein
VHPIGARESRVLRRLQRETKTASPYVFVSERGINSKGKTWFQRSLANGSPACGLVFQATAALREWDAGCLQQSRHPSSCCALAPVGPPVPRPSITRPGRPQASHRAAWQPQEPPSCAPRSVRRIVPAGTSRNGPPPANLSIAAIVIRCAALSIVISASARAGWNISYRKQRRKVREPVREHVPSNTRPQLNARRSVHRSGISKRPHTLQVLPHRRTLVLLTQGICGRFRFNRL